MKFSEIKNKTASELKERLLEAKGELRDLRFRVGTGELKNVRQIRKLKKELARILTALRQAKV